MKIYIWLVWYLFTSYLTPGGLNCIWNVWPGLVEPLGSGVLIDFHSADSFSLMSQHQQNERSSRLHELRPAFPHGCTQGKLEHRNFSSKAILCRFFQLRAILSPCCVSHPSDHEFKSLIQCEWIPVTSIVMRKHFWVNSVTALHCCL